MCVTAENWQQNLYALYDTDNLFFFGLILTEGWQHVRK